jgi:DNA-directed RNA polymerase specialized sigma24 family protein
MDASEREQYRAAIHGDREAFEMIIRTHSRILFAIAYGILQNREEAEDVVQDTLVKSLENALARARSGKISRLARNHRSSSRSSSWMVAIRISPRCKLSGTTT